MGQPIRPEDAPESAKPSVLFVCTGNAGRSQIAQAMLRRLAGERVAVESAGVAPWEHLHPMAVQVMAERGFDLAGHYPKSATSVMEQRFDLVITIGERARQDLPRRLSQNATWLHWDISDPADADGTPESEAAFERTADAIAARLPKLVDILFHSGG